MNKGKVTGARVTHYEVAYPSDWHAHEGFVDHIKDAVHGYLHMYWGERCADYDPDCPCCQRWDLFDKLIENPFDKPEE